MKPIMVVLISALVGIAAFFGGTEYQKKQVPTFGSANRFSQGQSRTGAMGGGRMEGSRNADGKPITGEITSSDDSSITVKTTDGGSRIVILDNTTSYTTSSTAAKTDVKTGGKVMVIGTQNSDGSVTAQSVQLNPIERAFGGMNQTPKQ